MGAQTQRSGRTRTSRRSAPVDAEQKPADEQQPKVAEPDQCLTPEALNALAAKSPELKAAMDASPEVKNALFAMARTNAKAEPVLKYFPNEESAKFAAETSNTMVNTADRIPGGGGQS